MKAGAHFGPVVESAGSSFLLLHPRCVRFIEAAVCLPAILCVRVMPMGSVGNPLNVQTASCFFGRRWGLACCGCVIMWVLDDASLYLQICLRACYCTETISMLEVLDSIGSTDAADGIGCLPQLPFRGVAFAVVWNTGCHRDVYL
ncbi:hypothetical protein Nepgr_005329 [Nepenthes gracilis]|uniref:Uncharacterized protein n=1 Tax=Nepenthes gracilis TaxID=150966 RepID=A0AAD3S2Z4_NEPGR|nr:hypothetical protein Nepgr_005329 [Nepenthes gracilis]